MDTNPIPGILAHVRERVHDYFGEFDSTSVQVVVKATDERQQSTMYWLELRAGDRRRKLLVKISHPGRAATPVEETAASDRPRLGLVTDCHVKHEFEYRGLVAVQEHFGRLGDDRFGTVRPFDYIPEAHAVVMEVVEEPTLRRLLLRATRIAAPFARDDLSFAFRNVGAWLRIFHELPSRDEDDLPALRQTPDDILRVFDVFTSYLEARLPADGLGNRIATAVTAHTRHSYPDRLPLGLGHGDYAPRNVFVQRGGRIRVIDMLARLRVPIYEDLAYFTVALRTTALHLLARDFAFDRARILRYEEAFIHGYFGNDEPPRRALALYELLVLLDKWSSHVAGGQDPVDRPSVLRRARAAVADRHFAAEAQRLLNTIEPT